MGPYLLYRHINVEHSLLIDHVQGVLYDLSLYKLCSPMCSPNLHVNVQLGNRGPSYDRNIYGHLSKVRRRMWSSISNDWEVKQRSVRSINKTMTVPSIYATKIK